MILPNRVRLNPFAKSDRRDYQTTKDDSKDSMDAELLLRLERKQSEILYTAQLQQLQKLAEQNQKPKKCERIFSEQQRLYINELQKSQSELNTVQTVHNEQLQTTQIDRMPKLFTDSALLACQNLLSINQSLLAAVTPTAEPIAQAISQNPWPSPGTTISALPYMSRLPSAFTPFNFLNPFNMATALSLTTDRASAAINSANIVVPKRSQEHCAVNLNQAIHLPSPESQVVPSISPSENGVRSMHGECETESKRSRLSLIELKNPEPCSTNGITEEKQKRKRPHRNEEEDDNDEQLFVDVESVDEKVDSKEHRRALIDFYRKLKTLRPREGKLICRLCCDSVQNTPNTIRTHVYSHADVMPYRCKVCGAEARDLDLLYIHIKKEHPRRQIATAYENRRDMVQLTALLLACFPRTYAKPKDNYNEIITKLCEALKDKGLMSITCQICSEEVAAFKTSILKHAHTHKEYKCKHCSENFDGEVTVCEHCEKEHHITKARVRADYTLCLQNPDRSVAALKQCFSNFIGK